MIINSTNMAAVTSAYKARFRGGFDVQNNEHTAWWGVEPSTTKTENFPLLLQSSGMREWIGERNIKDVSADMLSLVNKKYEETISIEEDEFEDDQHVGYGRIFQQMGVSSRNLWPDVAFDALVENGTWIDGVAFYKTDRTYGDSTINNLTTSALSVTTFNTAYDTMCAYRGHGGKSLKVKPSRLIVGPSLRTTAEAILKNRYVGDGETSASQIENLNYERVELEIHEDLVGDYASYWFMLDDRDAAIPPIIVLNRRAPRFIAKTALTDDNMFFDGSAVYGTDARCVGGKTLPHKIYGGIVSS